MNQLIKQQGGEVWEARLPPPLLTLENKFMRVEVDPNRGLAAVIVLQSLLVS